MSSFQLAKGMKVTNLEGIHECYQVRQQNDLSVFTANISAPNILPLVKSFCRGLAEPCFFILEAPVNRDVENQLRKSDTDPLHYDVYYWDGLSIASLLDILGKYGELLINDGMCRFGFASHASRDEIYIGKYNIAKIFTRDEERYEKFLGNFDIPKENEIKTVWDNFSKDTPGEAIRIEIDGRNIYSLIDELKEKGLYWAETREE